MTCATPTESEAALDACELVFCTHWSGKLRKAESDLFQSKWWDYRHLTVVEATRLFGQCFSGETRRIIRAHIDDTPPKLLMDGTYKDWEPLQKGDIFRPPLRETAVKAWKSKIHSLIRARQDCDRAGVPYPFYMRVALRHWYFGRYYFIQHRTMPSTAMLNSPECYNAVLQSWMEAIASQIQVATHDRYRLPQSEAHPDIEAHQVWLCKQIARKPEPKYALRKFMQLGFLSREIAEQHFSPMQLQAAIA